MRARYRLVALFVNSAFIFSKDFSWHFTWDEKFLTLKLVLQLGRILPIISSDTYSEKHLEMVEDSAI